MPGILAALRVGAIWLGRIGLAALTVSEIQRLFRENETYFTQSAEAASEAGLTADEATKLVAATTYDQVEQKGGNPEDFWAGLSPAEKEALKFSPQSLQSDIGRTKFLGLSSAFLFATAIVAGGFAGVRGIPILLSTLVKLRAARAAGASALQLTTIIEEGKILGIANVWIPGLVGSIASAGGWLTSSMTNNLNDATLWGRIFLGQAADDFEKAQKQRTSGTVATGGSTSSAGTAKIIIRMVEEKKPEQFIGTLFSAKLGTMQSFERHIDDEITDEADLMEDAKLNLNRWLQSFAGRLGYSIVIRKDPVDEYGTKQSGIWATMTMHITRLNGGIQPIDTILLGPVSPQTKLVLSKTLKTVEQQLPAALSADTVRVIEVPTGTVDVFDAAGEKVAGTSTISIASKAATAAPATAAVAAAAPSAAPAEGQGLYQIEISNNAAGYEVIYYPPGTTPNPNLRYPGTAAPSPTPPTKMPSTPTSTPAVTPPAEAQQSGGSPLASSSLQQSPLLQGSAVATSPVLTPAQPEYDKSKYFQGVRGALDDRWPWYGNRFVRVNTGGDNLNIRTGASTSLPISWKAPNGSVIVFKRWIGQRDGYDWGEVTDASGTRSGFAALMYLELT